MGSLELPALPALVDTAHTVVVEASDYLILNEHGRAERYATLQRLRLCSLAAQSIDTIAYRYPGYTINEVNVAFGGVARRSVNLRGHFTTIAIGLCQAGRPGDQIYLAHDVKFDPWNSVPNQFLRVAGALGMQSADLTVVFHNACLPNNVVQTELCPDAADTLVTLQRPVTLNQYGESDTYSIATMQWDNLSPDATVGFAWSW